MLIVTYLGLDDLKIAHLNARSREIRDFEFHADRALAFPSLADSAHAAPKAAHHTTTTLVIAANRG